MIPICHKCGTPKTRPSNKGMRCYNCDRRGRSLFYEAIADNPAVQEAVKRDLKSGMAYSTIAMRYEAVSVRDVQEIDAGKERDLLHESDNPGSASPPNYMPTEEEIQDACLEIQAGWSDGERKARWRGDTRSSVEFPTVSVLRHSRTIRKDPDCHADLIGARS